VILDAIALDIPWVSREVDTDGEVARGGETAQQSPVGDGTLYRVCRLSKAFCRIVTERTDFAIGIAFDDAVREGRLHQRGENQKVYWAKTYCTATRLSTCQPQGLLNAACVCPADRREAHAL